MVTIGKKPLEVYLRAALYELGNKGMVQLYALGMASGTAIKVSHILKRQGHPRTAFEYYETTGPARDLVDGKWVINTTKPERSLPGIHIEHRLKVFENAELKSST